ncbi:MAG: FAD-dependent oxidoreductase [Bacteroidales bacterium]|nr:FAD-dependent oxidoreductase [Bacteroidales bacterium]MBR1894130.1 FAD-dependent oxidoreductase [Bacteroidales bacterium]
MDKTNSVMVLATTFADKGDWIVEQQFVLQMGSSYLLAHGIGTPLEKDAVTTVEVPVEGDYHLLVRTKNWTAFWSEGKTPGIFSVKVDGVADAAEFGTGCEGATRSERAAWYWQQGGTWHLTAGTHTLALHDLTGFDGRCDALILTTSDEVPDRSLETYCALRESLLGPNEPVDKGTYDLVVVGGGMSGICAALAAARLGSKVALVQDRYILGGNNSSEVRVGLGGQINMAPYPSLGYLLNEIGPDRIGNARGAHHYQDWKKMDVVKAEPNISLFLGYTVTDAVMEDGKIRSVTAIEATRQDRIVLSGHTFADCTGDAHLAVLAGAETRMGREARSEYGESLAPEKADDYTMGVSIEWYCEDWNTPCSFPDSLDWGLHLDEETVEPVHRANWYWEVGMNDDQVADAEKIRDYGMYVAYSTFSYCKNRLAKKEDWECTHLVWVSHVSGKRESRRIIGDLVLREQDLTRPIPYEDGTCTTTWRIDQHYPDPRNAGKYPGAEWMSIGKLVPIDPYALPYRCFYSKDVANLFMAGRDISVTHIALGSVRVMRTCAMMGEVVGMAASICSKRSVLPRDIYTTYFEDLKALMRKGTGRTDVPYTQFYHQVDRTGHQAEDR